MTDAQNPHDPTRPPQSPQPGSDASGQDAPPAYGDTPPVPPAYTDAPPAPPAYGDAPPAYAGAPAYPGAQPGNGEAPAGPVPGKTLGIVALVLSFFAALIGLILGIVARSQSKKAGVKNGPALAAIIISSVFIVISIILAIILVPLFFAGLSEVARFCAEVGPGIHETTSGVTIPCE